MANETQSRPSFSSNRKWTIGVNVILATVIVMAIIVMVNYLAGQYSQRLYLSRLTRIDLSPRTLSVLRSLTNSVAVTIYYDRSDTIYRNISDLLNEYQRQNSSKITLRTIDYYRDPAAAAELKIKYKLGSSTNRNFIIFDCGGHTRFINGSELPDFKYDPVPGAAELTYDRKLVAFNGEMYFTAALYSVSNPKAAKAYFLAGHGELSMDDAADSEALQKFAELLRQNYIQPEYFTLLTNSVPPDCSLVVVAAPQKMMPDEELDLLDQYLNQGGRMLVLFNAYGLRRLGIEKLLAKWGVDVATNAIHEPILTRNKQDMIVPGLTLHPVTKSLLAARTPLHMIFPRRIGHFEPPSKVTVEVPRVTELVFSSPDSSATDDATPHRHCLAVAVEKTTAKGGSARLIVCGDSFLFGNELIDDPASGNRDFADAAVNWLLERSTLLEGLGPRQVVEHQILMSQSQMRAVQWILLAAIPGGIILFGGLVWFRRRK